MGFGINAAVMSGVNDGLRQIKNDEWLDQSRQREAATADLNHQVLSGQVEDMNRARGDHAAVRAAFSEASAKGVGQVPSLEAARKAAEARGDINTANILGNTMRKARDEGLTDLLKWSAMQGNKAFAAGSPEAMEGTALWNKFGDHRFADGALAQDDKGNLHGVDVNGKQYSINVPQAMQLFGLTKPDEYISTPFGPASKRTGLGADGKPLSLMKDHPLNSNFVTRKNADGSETLVDLRGPLPADGNPNGASGPNKVDDKVHADNLSYALKINGASDMNGLDPANAARVHSTVRTMNELWSANSGGPLAKFLDPAKRYEIAEQISKGKLPIAELTLANGQTVKGTIFDGRNVFLEDPRTMPQPGAPTPQPAVTPATPAPVANARGAARPMAPAAPAAMDAQPGASANVAVPPTTAGASSAQQIARERGIVGLMDRVAQMYPPTIRRGGRNGAVETAENSPELTKLKSLSGPEFFQYADQLLKGGGPRKFADGGMVRRSFGVGAR